MLYSDFEIWATALMIAVCIALGVRWSYSKCHSRAAMQGMEDGTWMDYDRLRYME